MTHLAGALLRAVNWLRPGFRVLPDGRNVNSDSKGCSVEPYQL
jgi:hypothetical protein